MGKIRDGLVKAGAIGLIAGGVVTVGLGVKTVFNGSTKKFNEIDNQKKEIITSVCQEDEYKAYMADRTAEYAKLYNNDIIPRYKYESLVDQENMVDAYLQKNGSDELSKLRQQEDKLEDDNTMDAFAAAGEMAAGGILMYLGGAVNHMLKDIIIREAKEPEDNDTLEQN